MSRFRFNLPALARAEVAGLLVLGGMLVAPSAVFAQAETIEYYGTDAIGSIRIVWDASGNMIARQDFAPFGEPVLQQGTALPKEGFVGNETDAETNQDYFHARMYEARTGRFTRTDPIEDGVADPQEWNRYAYARNNPLSFTDVTGLQIEFGCDSTWTPYPDGTFGGTLTQPTNCPNPDFWNEMASLWFGGGGPSFDPDQTAPDFGGGPTTLAPTTTNTTTTTTTDNSDTTQQKDRSAARACVADVAINYALGFIPGYNALKLTASFFGLSFNPAEGMTGTGSWFHGSITATGAAKGTSDYARLYANASFEAAGGQSALERAADLASRASFSTKSASSQAKILEDLSNLSQLGKIASVAGGLAEVANLGSALYDAHACLSK